jgi:hypothetical protein
MFWAVMTAIDCVATVVIAVLAVYGAKVGIGADRRSRMKSGAFLMATWSFVCYGHYLVGG